LLLALSMLSDYPLEKFSLIASVFNPIDLSRILILLKLDVSALMGFTGAVFRKFLGTGLGMGVAFGVLLAWVVGPVLGIRRVAARKDF
jgi:Cu-processing system permease protein